MSMPATLSLLPLQRIDARHFQAWAEDVCQAGDWVLVAFERRGLLWRVVGSMQRRMIRQLHPAMPPAWHAAVAEYVHAAMVTRHGDRLEMTSPRCRLASWETTLRPGDRLIVLRPLVHRVEFGGVSIRDFTPDEGQRAAVQGLLAVGTRYPYWEALGYWVWSWGVRRLICRQRFSRIFDGRRAVCSAAVWQWTADANAWTDLDESTPEANPAGHYPAELLATPRARIYAGFVVVPSAPRHGTCGRCGEFADGADSLCGMCRPATISADIDYVTNTGDHAMNPHRVRKPILALFLGAVGLAIMIALSGCNSFNNTRYANNLVERFDRESMSNASMGNAAAQSAMFNADASPAAGSPTGGFQGEGAGHRAAGWMVVAGDSSRTSDVDTAAVLTSMRRTDSSASSTTAPQAIDTSTAQGTSTANPAITDTTTTELLSGNQAQMPIAPQGQAQTGGQTMGPQSPAGAAGSQAAPAAAPTDAEIQATEAEIEALEEAIRALEAPAATEAMLRIGGWEPTTVAAAAPDRARQVAALKARLAELKARLAAMQAARAKAAPANPADPGCIEVAK